MKSFLKSFGAALAVFATIVCYWVSPAIYFFVVLAGILYVSHKVLGCLYEADTDLGIVRTLKNMSTKLTGFILPSKTVQQSI